MKTLFINATAQTEANYYMTWHLFKNSNTDIQKIVIVSTDFTQKNGHVNNLIGVLKAVNLNETHNVSVEELHLKNGIEESDMAAIKTAINNWIETNKPSSIIFNITGGTKLMSIAQDQIAQTNSRYECVYQSRSNNQLVWYNRLGAQCYDLILPENIEVRLKARGYEAVSTETAFLNLPAAQYQYADKMRGYMMADVNKTQKLASLLNALASGFLNKSEASFPHSIQLTETNTAKDCLNWIKMLAQLPEPYFLFDAETNKLTWQDKQAVQFVGGKWFEVLTALLAFQHYTAKAQEVDIKIGLQFKKSSDGNEIDVAFVQKSYLHLFECKTVNWNNLASPTTAVNTNLHKLHSIGQVGGLNTHGYFVSLFDISDKSQAVANDLGIQVITGKQLLDIGRYIR